jgi:hypothetical protein
MATLYRLATCWIVLSLSTPVVAEIVDGPPPPAPVDYKLTGLPAAGTIYPSFRFVGTIDMILTVRTKTRQDCNW